MIDLEVPGVLVLWRCGTKALVGAVERFPKLGAERERVRGRKLGGSGGMLPRKIGDI